MAIVILSSGLLVSQRLSRILQNASLPKIQEEAPRLGTSSCALVSIPSDQDLLLQIQLDWTPPAVKEGQAENPPLPPASQLTTYEPFNIASCVDGGSGWKPSIVAEAAYGALRQRFSECAGTTAVR